MRFLSTLVCLLSILGWSSCGEKENDVCTITEGDNLATGLISLDQTEWSANAYVRPFKVYNDTTFIQIQLNHNFPDGINTESLRFYLPDPEVGDIFFLPDGIYPDIWGDRVFTSFQFHTMEVDIVTEFYGLTSIDVEEPNFIAIDEIDDCGNISGKFNLNLEVDPLHIPLFLPKERPDTFGLNGTFRALNLR